MKRLNIFGVIAVSLMVPFLGYTQSKEIKTEGFERYSELLPYVVQIEMDNDLGTGLVVGISGERVYVVTAYHVAVPNGFIDTNNNLNYKVCFSDIGCEDRVKLLRFKDSENFLKLTSDPLKRELYPDSLLNKIIGEETELAVLEIITNKTTFLNSTNLSYGIKNKLKKGKRIVMIGNPNGKSLRINEDNTFVEFDEDDTSNTFETTSLGITNGYSGGPVFTRDKKWIGVINLTSARGTTCIKINELIQQMELLGFPTNLMKSNPISVRQFINQQSEITKISVPLGIAIIIGGVIWWTNRKLPEPYEIKVK